MNELLLFKYYVNNVCIESTITESIPNITSSLVSEECTKKKLDEPKMNINKRQLNANGICAGVK